MVVPCYNKENYIGAMLDSVLAQEWNNIEIILVNDGSTDKTREVIVSYLPKFEKRGYDVKLIDQDNGGCCKAVHTGLINMTGEYYCLIDADDEIEPTYVSTMAGWLEEHDDYEWTACSYRAVNILDGKRTVNAPPQYPYPQDCDNLLTHYIFRRVITTVWIYMMRTSYMRQCGMIENFCAERSKTYEPLIMVPPAALGGKLKFFDEPLYRYNIYAS
jgi:glycosyltransferase involved in cell wall biosynthesis